MNKSIMRKCFAVVIVLVLLGVGFTFFSKSQAKQSPGFTIDTADQPTRGNPQAKVHIVVFEDLKCIACKHFNNTILPDLKKQYLDTGIAKYTVVNLAFIPGSIPAANAARCIYKQNPDGFFTFVDNVYLNQPPENEDWATLPRLMQFADVVPGVDKDKLSKCIYDSPYTDFIQNNLKMAAKLQGPSVQTPAVYVNGHYIDPPTFSNLRKAIDAER
jgi:protein-disulfide isomerase